MNWFTDKLYDLAASPRAGEAAWGELAAQDAMSPRVKANYYEGLEMPPDPRAAGWRSAPRMGDTVAPPSDTAWMLPPEGSARVDAPSQEVARRFGASGLTPPPARSAADAYRMGGMANLDEYRKAPDAAWRDIDRAAIEDQYGGADIHGIKLPPVSRDEPKAWRDTIIGETPADALVNWGLGGTGRMAKGALALGGLFKMTDPAEAGVISKAGGLLRGKPGGPHPGGIAVYHSSPHDFDRFDWSKLRTGEGANTYGAGFYFAENPKVSGQGGQYWKAFAERFNKGDEGKAVQYLKAHNIDRKAAADALDNEIAWHDFNIKEGTVPRAAAENERIRDQLLRARDMLLSGNPIGPRTYEVNINARPELMLDWDKPMTQQDPVMRALAARVGMDPRDYDVTKGAALYRKAGDYFGPKQSTSDFDKAASEGMRDYGIPGIRYLDQGSRQHAADIENARKVAQQMKGRDYGAWGEELAALEAKPLSYNYVVTDPSKLDILAKYGIVGGAPVGMGAIAAQDRYQQ